MPLNEPLNTRVVPGSNEATDFAKQVTERLADEYVGLTNTLAELKAEVPGLPIPAQSDHDILMIGALIKRFRDLDSRAEGVRVVEKEPYLRGGNAVDAFFNAMRDEIGKRNRNDRKAKNGVTDDLQAEINVYQERKLAEERARREAEAREAARIAREAAEKAAREAREAEAARLAAERARLPETTAAKTAVADQKEHAATIAQVEAQTAIERAEDARIATLAKPADLTRVRGADASGAGVTLTTAQEPYAILVDRDQIDMNMLRPFFTDAEIEKALRGWAKTTGHRVKMPGAEIGFRNKGVTR